MEKYINYARALDARQEVIGWLQMVLAKHLEKNPESQDDVEHIIDYLCSDSAPTRIQHMAYGEAKSNTEKWSKSLQKKGEHIKETAKDTEVVLDFKDGFKIVKLIGKNAYEREGYLMRHCCGSYFGKDKEVYSLRDKSNNPHCTIEKNQQIKGKGNGDISPKYIHYVVEFLKSTGMTVGD